jgi:ethanolaminephosphotransferase
MVFILCECTLNSFYNVASSCKAKNKSIMKAMLGVLPFVYYNGMLVMWLYYSPTILHRYFVPMTLAVAFGFGNMVGRMIVAHVIHDSFPYFNIAFVPMTVGALGAWSGLLTVQQQVWLLYALLAFGILVHSHFIYYVINRICVYLDINCLTIKRKYVDGTPVSSPSAKVSTPGKVRTSTRKAAAAAAAIIAETPQRPYGRKTKRK